MSQTTGSDSIRLVQPAAGATTTVPVNAPKMLLVLGFTPDPNAVSKNGQDLTFSFENGGKIVLQGYYNHFTSKTLPVMVAEDGEQLPGEQFLASLSEDLLTATGPVAASAVAPAGGGLNAYADGAANLVGGLERLGSLGSDQWGRGTEVADFASSAGLAVAFADAGPGVAPGAGVAPGPGAGAGDAPADAPVFGPAAGLPPVNLGMLATLALGTVYEGALAEGGSGMLSGGPLPGGVSVNLSGLPSGWTVTGGTGTYGSFTQGPDGSWTYTLTAASRDHGLQGHDAVVDNVTLTLVDSFGRNLSYTVPVTVVDDAPVIAEEAGSLGDHGSASVGGEGLDFSFGADNGAGKSLTIESIDGLVLESPISGIPGAEPGSWVFSNVNGNTLTLNSDGSFRYEAPDGGKLTVNTGLTITIKDADGDSQTASVQIGVVKESHGEVAESVVNGSRDVLVDSASNVLLGNAGSHNLMFGEAPGGGYTTSDTQAANLNLCLVLDITNSMERDFNNASGYEAGFETARWKALANQVESLFESVSNYDGAVNLRVITFSGAGTWHYDISFADGAYTIMQIAVAYDSASNSLKETPLGFCDFARLVTPVTGSTDFVGALQYAGDWFAANRDPGYRDKLIFVTDAEREGYTGPTGNELAKIKESLKDVDITAVGLGNENSGGGEILSSWFGENGYSWATSEVDFDAVFSDVIVNLGGESFFLVPGSDLMVGGQYSDIMFGDADALGIKKAVLAYLKAHNLNEGGITDPMLLGSALVFATINSAPAAFDFSVASHGPHGTLGDQGDVLIGGAGNDILYGQGGNDLLIGGGSVEIFDGLVKSVLGAGAPGLGGLQGEALRGLVADLSDALHGKGFAGDGSTLEDLGALRDFAAGVEVNIESNGDGDTILFGGAGHDILIGGSGNDLLYGGTGNDILIGGSGDDVLYGGRGNDLLYGGSGSDLFAWNASDYDGGTDTIIDFTLNEDRLSFADIFSGAAQDSLALESLLAAVQNGKLSMNASVDADSNHHLTITVNSDGGAHQTVDVQLNNAIDVNAINNSEAEKAALLQQMLANFTG